MFRSLRTRLWLTYAVLISSVLCLISLSVAVYFIRNPAVVRQDIVRLELAANLYQRIQNLLDSQDENRLQQITERADRNLNVRFIVLDPSGKLLADSRLSSAPPPPKIELPTPTSARFENVRLFRDHQNQVWLYTLRLMDDGNILVACLPRSQLTLRLFLRENYWGPFVRSGLVALLLSLGLAWWVSRWVVSPLEKMKTAMQRAASGKYEPIPLEGPQEVQALAESFNKMTHKVQASEKSQRDFVANVSHDLKTPLTSIKGFAQAILDGTANSPKALHQAASVIYNEADRMHRMVLSLLDLARLDSGTAEFQQKLLDLIPLLQGVVAQFLPQAQAGQIDLQTQFTSLPAVVGDADRLTQAISNLVDNAIKYSAPGGKVLITASTKGGEVEIAVVDNGPGIPPDELPQIFDRFYRSDKSRAAGSGAGLGLTISREIILAHGGKIFAYNNAILPPSQRRGNAETFSHGSTFVVHLPVARPAEKTTNLKRSTASKGS